MKQTTELAEYIETIRADARAQCLREFAHFLDGHRPGAVQLKISPDYNDAVIRTLEWAAEQARGMADTLQPAAEKPDL